MPPPILMALIRATQNLAGLTSAKWWVGLFLCFSLGSLTQLATARDLGIIGPTYPIVETDLLSVITHKLQALQQQAKFQHLQKDWQTQVASHADRPQAVAGLTQNTNERHYTVDMSIKLQQPITDAAGHIVYPAGTRLNPLTLMPLSSTLLFIDGDEAKQWDWARKKQQEHSDKAKLILIKGSLHTAYSQWQGAVYFDQGGYLVQRFGLQHVPAQVKQQGDKLQVQEFKLP